MLYINKKMVVLVLKIWQADAEDWGKKMVGQECWWAAYLINTRRTWDDSSEP